MKILIATRNEHKLEEIASIFTWPTLDILSPSDFANLPEVVEDGRTFQDNAIKKAQTLARLTHIWTLADDSGLEVDALGGKPGVYSARFSGEKATCKANNDKLLQMLQGVQHRTARFRCVIALVSPKLKADTVEGICEGTIAMEPRGSFGFGYDPLFIPKGYNITFAQMNPAQKNRISHRYKALALAKEKWAAIFNSLEDPKDF